MRAFAWILCCLAGAATCTPTDEILDAVAVLQANGISTEALCHPTSRAFEPALMRCGSNAQAPADSSMLHRFVFEPRPARLLRHRQLEEESGGATAGGEESHDTWFLVSHAFGAFSCVCVAALAAGLTMGLLSLDPLLLLIKMRASTSSKERKDAESLLPIVKQHHLLLVTLLLLNSMANEALPLFLEVLVSPLMAVVLSVTFVLFFGEIIPSAIFTGPNKIALAAKMAPIVKFVMCLLYPISYPIAKILDRYLHEDDDDGHGSGADLFNRGELSALVRIQYEERMAAKQQRKKEKKELLTTQHLGGLDLTAVGAGGDASVAAAIRASKREATRQQSNAAVAATAAATASDANLQLTTPQQSQNERTQSTNTIGTATNSVFSAKKFASSIHVDEVIMVEGALAMKTKMAMDVFTPLHRVYAIPYHTELSERHMVQIYSRGFSRVPVFEINPNKPKDIHAIRGILMTKQLIVVNPNDCRPVETLPLAVPMCVSPKINLVDLLNLFQSGSNGHMALVCARPERATEALMNEQAVPDAAGLMGLITIEDVLEALLQEQIYDETDRMERDAARIARWTSRKWKAYVRKRKAARAEAEPEVSMEDVVVHVLHDEALGEHTPLVPGEKFEDEIVEGRKSFFGLF